MDRTHARCVALFAALSATLLVAASTARAAPDRAAAEPVAGPLDTLQVDGKSAPRRSPPARAAGKGRARPKAAPSRTARPPSRKAPPPKTRPPVKRTSPPRRTAPPPRSTTPKRTTPPTRGTTPKRTGPPTRGTPRPRTTPPPRRAPRPETAPPTRGTPRPRTAPPPRRSPRPETTPPSRHTPRPHTTPPPRREPRPRTTPPEPRAPRDVGGRNGNDVDVRRDYFRRLWERRHETDRREPPAPRRRGPDVTVTPRSSDAPSGVVDRPDRDRPGGGKHDKPKGDGKHGGKHGHGKYGGKHGHHHHAWCGCYLQDWWRLLYGTFGWYGRADCDPYDYRYVIGPTYITYADTPAPPIPFGPQPCAATGPEAWALLGDGHAAAAYEIFECLSRSAPDDGYLLVGLAIAATSVGEHDVAVTALRTAMRTDPVSLLDVPAGDPIDALLASAADHYDARARGGYGDVDALFMVAAMRYLLGEDHAAHYAVEVAVALGDEDAGTRNLKGLIEATPPDLRRPE